MNPSQQSLYRIHQLQSEHLGEVELPYEEFNARLLKASESDLTGLLPSPIDEKLKIQITINTRFQLGHLSVVQSVAGALPADEVLKAIERHAGGDWGTLGESAWQENAQALRSGRRLFSVYEISGGRKLHVTTSADRSVTTVALAEHL